ncbi:MAG: hypothetical protein H0U75_05740 [Legionella sp.]|nr:hypothetical protein [Legionella sp.]
MSDYKSKLPDFKEITSIVSKLFKDIKNSVDEVVKDYKDKRKESEETPQEKSTQQAQTNYKTDTKNQSEPTYRPDPGAQSTEIPKVVTSPKGASAHKSRSTSKADPSHNVDATHHEKIRKTPGVKSPTVKIVDIDTVEPKRTPKKSDNSPNDDSESGL